MTPSPSPDSDVGRSPEGTPPGSGRPGAEPGFDLEGRHVVLALSGGIACYKAADLARELTKAGATVQAVMTPAAERFVTALTLQALTGRPVATSTWDGGALGADNAADGMPHIHLTRHADAVLVAPATADAIAALAHGRADDLLSLLCLARPRDRCRLLVAPAMNREMWTHPATQRNLALLRDDGAVVLGPGSGAQACGETGDGRMLEPAELCADLIAALTPKVLAGRRVLITAGPTFEPIDPVRGITNRSSGKMGYAIARAAHEAGATVLLVSGPVHLPTPRGVQRIDVQTAQEMLAAVLPAATRHDVFIATAAVADWRPSRLSEHKIKKNGAKLPPLFELTENTDILAAVAALPAPPYCVGFAAESHDLVAHARDKLVRKNVPLIVANLGPTTFGRDDNVLTLVDATGERVLPLAHKRTLARQLVDEIATRLAGRP